MFLGRIAGIAAFFLPTVSNAVPHSVDVMSPEIVAGIIETCASTPTCRSTSMLPVTIHTGTFAHCATSSTRNTKVDTGTPAGIYLFYEIESGCGTPVVAKAKIGDEWHDAGLIFPNRVDFISILYSSGLARTPTVVMFCPGPGQPLDDQRCAPEPEAAAQAQPTARACALTADDYPPSARRQNLQGAVEVGYRVDASGNVEDAWVLRSSGYPVLDEASLRKIRTCQFGPAAGTTNSTGGATSERGLRFVWRLD